MLSPRGADADLIGDMCGLIAHRGPDGEGVFCDGPVGLGIRRLAIIDLDTGDQPIHNEDGSITLVYNGETYNFKSLRTELEAAGHIFRTKTDTEVLVHAYEEWGVSMLPRLRGMFGFALWDAKRQRLLLARDRMGEKPLYYTHLGDTLLFASEIKALLAHPELPRRVNQEALLQFLLTGFAIPPLTLFEGIYKLPPAHFMLVGPGPEPEIERYWQPTMDNSKPPPYDEAIELVRAALIDAVESQLIADVPVGSFLSGGMDSSSVVAIMRRVMGRPIHTYSVGFDFEADSKFNVDSRYALLAARELDTLHHPITICHEYPLDQLYLRLAAALDEPVNEPSAIQAVYVAALARLHGVPVLLTGEAGDEQFLGYTHYRADRWLDRYATLPARLRTGLLTPLIERISAATGRFMGFSSRLRMDDPLDRYLSWTLQTPPDSLPSYGLPTDSYARARPGMEAYFRPMLEAPHTDAFAQRIAYTSLQSFVPELGNMRVDKTTMLMSIEARSPLEDYRLIDLTLRLPAAYKLRNGDFKVVMKEAIRGLVPDAILKRPKWGFFAPYSNWLRRDLRPLLDRYLSRENVRQVGLFDAETVGSMVESHLAGGYHMFPLLALLGVHLWHSIYIERSTHIEERLDPAMLYPHERP